MRSSPRQAQRWPKRRTRGMGVRCSGPHSEHPRGGPPRQGPVAGGLQAFVMRRAPEEDGAQRDSAGGRCRPGPGPPPSAGLHSDPDPGPPSPVSTFALQGSLGVGVPMAGLSALRYPSPTSVLGSSGQRWVRKPPGSERHGCGHGWPALGIQGRAGRARGLGSVPLPLVLATGRGGGAPLRALPAPGSQLRGTTWAPLVGGSRSPALPSPVAQTLGSPA